MQPADPIELADIRAAAARLAGRIEMTPCLKSRTLSEITGAQVWLKFENLQFTASFKERGALNKLLSMPAQDRARGVIAASAGNHAQGVAYHAQQLGVPATIVMPRFTSAVKIERTRGFGAEVVLHGDSFDEAREHAFTLMRERKLALIHPYDDPAIIAGQGTIALEMLSQAPELDCLAIAIGGGGLIAGIACAAKAIKPSIDIIGVESTRFASMRNAVYDEQSPFGSSTIADGIAVRTPGRLTSAIVRRLVSDIVLVDETGFEQAILLLLEVEKTIVEGAGAAGLAAMLAHRERFAGRNVGLVLCGGNIDPLLLGEIIERGMVRSGRLTRLRVDLRDVPGALAKVTALIADRQANIEEVHHQRAFSSLPVQSAEVDFVLQTRGHRHAQEVLDALIEAGFNAERHDH